MFRNRAALVAVLVLWGACAKPLPAPALDFESALRQVAEANPSLAARRAMVEAARRRIAPAGAWSAPMMELGAINCPTSGRFDMDPMTTKMVALSHRVPVFGPNRLSRRAADAGLID